MEIDEQVAYLMQGTEYGDMEIKQAMTDELRQRLIETQQEGRPLKVYCGYDPTKADLHLGHTVTMRKLRQFQELGHEVTFLIGNYTSLVGDPSDKESLRPTLSQAEIEENARTYAEQAFRILDPKKTIIRYNGEWLSKLTLVDMIHLASNFTIQQLLTRENFKLRWERGDAVYLHETFYAILQGYDAYAMRSDVQVGGTDQMFNIVTAARKIMSYMGVKPNIAVLLGILPGTDGVVRMSKSLGNHIPINTTAEDMYGKVMSVPDVVVPIYSRLVTRWTPSHIEQFEQEIQAGHLHPRDAKMKLAHEITSTFYGEEEAVKAEEAFVRLFQQKDIPEYMPEFVLETGMTVVDVLQSAGLVNTKSEARRLIDQKGVRLDGQVLEEANMIFPHAGVLQVGKRHFVRVVEKR
ncbi:MAG TPA: tyrosine--tRNA ligase [Anaerolineaceae bacterium]|nr:tyrosine--tRNA ligase [Anaerolineaceae bacterium]